MTETLSAKIYQFPTGGRSQSARRSAVWPTANPSSLKQAAIASGSSWYHAEAIREDEKESAATVRLPPRQ